MGAPRYLCAQDSLLTADTKVLERKWAIRLQSEAQQTTDRERGRRKLTTNGQRSGGAGGGSGCRERQRQRRDKDAKAKELRSATACRAGYARCRQTEERHNLGPRP